MKGLNLNMDDKFSRTSGKDILDNAVRDLEKKGERYNFEDSIYTFPDEQEMMEVFNESNVNIENFEQLKKYVVERITVINTYNNDFIKEKGLTSVFREIYRFVSRPDYDEFDQNLIDELIDYIYDNSIYPVENVDKVAYLEMLNKGKGRQKNLYVIYNYYFIKKYIIMSTDYSIGFLCCIIFYTILLLINLYF